MATDVTPDYVPVAGLRVPSVLVPRIVASMRGMYPDLTVGLEDDPAVRAVLKFWVTSTLASWETRQVADQAVAQVQAVQAEAAEAAQAVREAAQAAAESITEAADPAVDDPAL